jgi:hypothetical protein
MCYEGCPPKRGYILIFFTPENGTNRQILLKRNCKVALEQDLSIGVIFRRKNYLYVPLILSTGQNGIHLSVLVLQLYSSTITKFRVYSCTRVQLY